MLERIVARIALGLFQWLEGRIERGSVAVDAERDRALLRRGAGRVRDWLRADGVRQRVDPDANRADGDGQDLPPHRG